VIAQHAIGADADGEDGGELGELLDDPVLTVIEVGSGQAVPAAKEGAAYAAADAVVVWGRLDIDLCVARAGHRESVAMYRIYVKALYYDTRSDGR